MEREEQLVSLKQSQTGIPVNKQKAAYRHQKLNHTQYIEMAAIMYERFEVLCLCRQLSYS